jgi:uncharacterized protein (UPF0548 family)
VGIALTRPTEQDSARLLQGLSKLAVSYPEVGATRGGELPDGYRHDRYSTTLRRDTDAFRLGKEALRSWQGHRHARMDLAPTAPPVVTGTDLVAILRIGPAYMLAPCRIVYVTDQDDEFGFGYGTLPGHPERGEEAFHLRRHHSGGVTFEIVAFSRPAQLLARLGGPISRVVQGRTTRAYLKGVRAYVANPL